MFRQQLGQPNSGLGLRVADIVLRQIEAGGIDSVRVALIADHAEVAVGTLYRHWGGRESMLEHTWRYVLLSVEHEVSRIVHIMSKKSHALDELWQALAYGLPDQLDAFFELHTARRRWHRRDIDSDGVVVPSLLGFVEFGQSFGHIRPGPPRLLAAMIWWMTAGVLADEGRKDTVRLRAGLDALKRVLLRPEVLHDDAIEQIEVTVEEPTQH